jgi:hypothetical protein
MTLFTFMHVVLSLIGIFSGFVVLFGLFVGKRLDSWTALFLASTTRGVFRPAPNVSGAEAIPNDLPVDVERH